MNKRNQINFIFGIFFALTILKLTTARTVTHYEIITKPNGDQIRRSWTTEESDEAGTVPNSNKPFKEFEPVENDRDFTELIKDAARRKGMDPESVAELLRTKAPVVNVTIDPKTGYKHTTTYKLEPSDGTGAFSIKSSTVVEIPTVVTMPQEHPYPIGGMIPMTRTYVNMEGKPVRETYGIPRRIRPSEIERWPVQMDPWHPQTMPLNTNEYYPRNPDTWRMPIERYNVGLLPNNQPRKDVNEEAFWLEPESEPMENPENQRERPTKLDPNNGRDDNKNSKTPQVSNKPLKQLVDDLYKTPTTTTTSRPTTTTIKPKTTSTQKPPTTKTTTKLTPTTTRKSASTKKPTTTTTATTTQKPPTAKTTTKNMTPTIYPRGNQETFSTSENPAKSDKCITNDNDDDNENDDRNVIVKYLSKVGLAIDDVVSEKHQTLTKTIIDDDGNILTATYMISSVKGHDPNPIK